LLRGDSGFRFQEHADVALAPHLRDSKRHWGVEGERYGAIKLGIADNKTGQASGFIASKDFT
jgi:hypothetical protein